MKLYAIIHRPEGDSLCELSVATQLQAQTSVESLGFPFDFISQELYEEKLTELTRPK